MNRRHSQRADTHCGRGTSALRVKRFVKWPAEPEFLHGVWRLDDPCLRRWGIRMARSDAHPAYAGLLHRLMDFAQDQDPTIQLESVLAADCNICNDTMRILLKACATCGDDPLIPQIVWQNLHPMIDARGPELLTILKEYDLKQHPNVAKLMPRITQRLLDRKTGE